MKFGKYASVCALFGIMIFVAIYAMLPEPETEPIIEYITPSSGSSETQLSSSSKSSNGTGSKSSRLSSGKSSKTSKSSSSSASVSESTVEYPLNINTATVEELAAVDGITDEIARLIVLYREQGGAYETKEELKLIKQISISLYNEIEDKLICE